MTRERLVLAAFLGCAVLAGGNAVGVRFSNRELAPLWGAGLRFALAAALAFALVFLLRVSLPRGRALLGTVLWGALNFGAAFAFAYYALSYLHAGLGQTLLALTPLATLLLAVVQHQERLTRRALGGTLLALAGVAVMSSAPLEAGVPPLAMLAMLGGVLSMAQAAILVRRFPPANPLAMNAVGMSVGAALLLAGSALSGEAFAMPQQTETLVALGYLVVVGSLLVFMLYLFVLRHWTASRAAYGFVIIPFVTVALSAWLDGERVGLPLIAGGVLVLGGVYVGVLRPAAPAVAPARTPAAVASDD